MAKRKASSLVSLAPSIVVLVLAVLAFIQYNSSVLYSKEANLKSQLFIMRDALDQYLADTGKCPESLSELVAGKYLRQVPVDPFTGSSTTWKFTLTQTERGTRCDVKSTSPKLAKNGGRYADW